MTGGAAVFAVALLLAAPVFACAPERIEQVSGLRADTPLTLAAADGTRFRLAGLEGEAAAPATGITRLARLGEADRHNRVPVIAFEGDLPVAIALLKAGAVRLVADPLVPRPCWQAMELAESEAVAARRGLWATADALLSATDAEALRRFDGRFAVVTGRVRSVRTVNRITYINFGPAGADALTVNIAERHMAAFRQNGLEPAAIRGHMLRVRGVVTVRRGPFIAAAMPAAITVMAAPAEVPR